MPVPRQPTSTWPLPSALPGRRLDPLLLIVAIAGTLGGLVVLGDMVLRGVDSPSGLALGLTLAVVPIAPVLACYLWLDRFRPEPRRLLIAGFLWGAAVAAGLALLINTTLSLFIGEAATVGVVAPLVEESAKGSFLLLLLLFLRRNQIQGVVDGLIYAGFVGVGFAFVENIGYLSESWAHNPAPDLMSDGGSVAAVFIIRCVLGPFAHPFFTGFTGIGIGLSVARPQLRVVGPLVGWGVAVLAHATWNGSTILGGGGGYFLIYGTVMIPAFIAVVAFAVRSRHKDAITVEAALHDAARRGLLPQSDIGWVVDIRARGIARKYARQHGGIAGYSDMCEYQRTSVEFGFLHHQVMSQKAPANGLAQGRELTQRIAILRRRIAFPAAQSTAR
jgi:RsiW-degrading membrane proteinase PrsW (M82 family)